MRSNYHHILHPMRSRIILDQLILELYVVKGYQCEKKYNTNRVTSLAIKEPSSIKT